MGRSFGKRGKALPSVSVQWEGVIGMTGGEERGSRTSPSSLHSRKGEGGRGWRGGRLFNFRLFRPNKKKEKGESWGREAFSFLYRRSEGENSSEKEVKDSSLPSPTFTRKGENKGKSSQSMKGKERDPPDPVPPSNECLLAVPLGKYGEKNSSMPERILSSPSSPSVRFLPFLSSKRILLLLERE